MRAVDTQPGAALLSTACARMRTALAPLAPEPWRTITVVEKTDSTNDDLLAAGRAGAAPGSLLFAVEQGNGRGRRGAAWRSPPGGVWMSALVHVEDSLASLLGLVGAVTVCRALDSLGVDGATVKWPNDVHVQDRKIAGVLAERFCAPAGASNAVLGVGLNVNLVPSDLSEEVRAIAIDITEAGSTAPDVSVADVAVLVAQELACIITKACDGNLTQIVAEARERLAWRGRNVVVDREGEILHGSLRDLADDGGLCIEVESGKTETCYAGTLRLHGNTSETP